MTSKVTSISGFESAQICAVSSWNDEMSIKLKFSLISITLSNWANNMTKTLKMWKKKKNCCMKKKTIVMCHWNQLINNPIQNLSTTQNDQVLTSRIFPLSNSVFLHLLGIKCVYVPFEYLKCCSWRGGLFCRLLGII